MRQRLVDLESQTAHARVDYHHAIKKLHAAGGSLREIAEVLDLSHQRVHQIVDGPSGPPARRPAAAAGRHGRRHGGRRAFFLGRFDDEAKEVMVQAQHEAESLKHNYVGTEHLMLAVVKRGVEGVEYDAARSEVAERIGEGDEPWIAGLPRPLTPRAKRALEAALGEASSCGPRAVRPGRHPPRRRFRPEGNGRRGARSARSYTRAAARAARPIAGATALPRRRSPARAAQLLVRPPRRAARRPSRRRRPHPRSRRLPRRRPRPRRRRGSAIRSGTRSSGRVPRRTGCAGSLRRRPRPRPRAMRRALGSRGRAGRGLPDRSRGRSGQQGRAASSIVRGNRGAGGELRRGQPCGRFRRCRR